MLVIDFYFTWWLLEESLFRLKPSEHTSVEWSLLCGTTCNWICLPGSPLDEEYSSWTCQCNLVVWLSWFHWLPSASFSLDSRDPQWCSCVLQYKAWWSFLNGWPSGACNLHCSGWSMVRTCQKWSQCQVQWTRTPVWLLRSLVGDQELEKLDFAQYLALPFQIPTGPQKHVHGCTFACCQTLTRQFPLFSLGLPAWSYCLRSSWSRYCRFCLVPSRWFEVIIQLAERVFCWIPQWTTDRWHTTIVQVESWSLQRKIQPWLIYTFSSYLLDIPRQTHLEGFAFLLKPSACYIWTFPPGC